MNRKSGYEKGISVIIPVFNVEKFLPICLDSIINQTFKDIDIICVLDSESKDNSENILEEFAAKDKRIRIIKPKDGSGPGYNRNVGLQYVRRERIGFIDSDDYIDEDYYERLYDISKLFNADVVMGQSMAVRPENALLNHMNKNSFMVLHSTLSVFRTNIEAACWDKLYKTEFVMKNGFKFPEGVFYEDTPLLLEVVDKSKTYITLPEDSYYYWILNSKSICFNTEYERKRYNDAISTMNWILDYIEQRNMTQREIETILMYMLPRFNFEALSEKIDGISVVDRINQICDYEKLSKKMVNKKRTLENLIIPTSKIKPKSWIHYTNKYYKDKYDGISVVVNIEDNSDNLKRCLDSLLAQTLDKFEILCVMNDTAKTNIKKIVKEYSLKDSRIKILENSTDEIPENVGIECATKSYIAFINSNDYVDKDLYGLLYRGANVFESEVVAGEFCDETSGSDYTNEFGVEYTLKRMYEKHKTPSFNNKIYSMKLLKENNIKFSDRENFSDNIFTFNVLSKTNKLTIIPDVKYYSSAEKREETVESFQKEIEDANTVLMKMCKILKNTDISLEYKSVVLEDNIQKYGIKALGYPEYTKTLSEAIEDVIMDKD